MKGTITYVSGRASIPVDKSCCPIIKLLISPKLENPINASDFLFNTRPSVMYISSITGVKYLAKPEGD